MLSRLRVSVFGLSCLKFVIDVLGEWVGVGVGGGGMLNVIVGKFMWVVGF